MEPLAITGLGITGPLGVGRSAWYRCMKEPAGHQAFRRNSSVLSSDKFPDAVVAEAWGFDAKDYLGTKGLRNFDRLTKLMIVAAKLALEDAGLKRAGAFTHLPGSQIGLCSSTAYGSLESITELKTVTEREDPRYLNPARFPNTVINSAAGYVSIWEELKAPNVTIVDGNCGALDAVLTCSTHLEHGRASAFLMGGGEALSEALYLAFDKLGIVAEGESFSNPGASDSAGMRLGEGAAFLCLEARHGAESRQFPYMIEIRGYGTAFEAPDSEAVLVHASAAAVARASLSAVADAGLQPSDIELVVTSLSGIPQFDEAELEGIEEAIGEGAAVVAPKSRYGETFGASGALACVSAVGWMTDVPLSGLIRGSNVVSPKHVLVLAVGYYGNASAVVLSHKEAE